MCLVAGLSLWAFALPGSSRALANIIYTIDLPSPIADVSVTGTITTDGALGTLSPSDFLDWDVTIKSTSLALSDELLGPGHSAADNTPFMAFDHIIATNEALFIAPFDIPVPGEFVLGAAANYAYVVVTPVPPGTGAEQLCIASDCPEIGLPYNSTTETPLGDNGTAQFVPEPSTFALFGSARIGLGAVRWCRRKAACAGSTS